MCEIARHDVIYLFFTRERCSRVERERIFPEELTTKCRRMLKLLTVIPKMNANCTPIRAKCDDISA